MQPKSAAINVPLPSQPPRRRSIRAVNGFKRKEDNHACALRRERLSKNYLNVLFLYT